MTVEALVVNGAKVREELTPKLPDSKEKEKLPYTPRVLAEPGRTYALMGKKNMFIGIAPAKVEAKEDKLTEEKQEVLRFVKLTGLWREADSTRWQATLYDQAKGGSEIKLSKSPSWRAKFKILDKYEETTIEGRVVHIDEEQLVFKTDEKYYRLRCGDFLYPAIRKPLSSRELRGLGIDTDEDVTASEDDSSQ